MSKQKGRVCSCLDWLVRPVLGEDDTEEEASSKDIMVKGYFLVWVGILVTNVEEVLLEGGIPASLEFYSTTLLWSSTFLAYPWLVWTKDLHGLLATLLAAVCVCVMAADMTNAAMFRPRSVGLFVVVLDVCLVCNMSSAYTNGIMAVAMAWILLTSFEGTYRFGLYDMPGLPPYDARKAFCDCEAPPCATGQVLDDTAVFVLVLLLDFVTTRGFSRDLRAKKAALEESIDVMRAIAQHLAAYDLVSANRVLYERSCELPPDMVDVFRGLLANLRSYRPYLPDALFTATSPDDGLSDDDSGWETVSASSVASPGRSSAGSIMSSKGSRRASHSRMCASVDALKPSQLEQKRVTLLLATMQLAELPGADGAATYIAHHSRWLSAVFTSVKAQRGSLDFFTGNRIYASFNAFLPARGHVVHAMAAAEQLQADEDGAVGTAVVTGAAHAGFLGTATIRSPTVVGPLMGHLELVARSREAVESASVCCELTARETVSLYPLRALLHTFVFESAAAAVTLYELVVTAGGKNENPQEWMYELERCNVWQQYNEAAAAFRTSGAAAALRAIEGADGATHFAKCEAEARVIDLRVRHTAHADRSNCLDDSDDMDKDSAV